VAEVRPDQVTLVPDPPDVLTSNAGWDTVKNAGQLREVLATLRAIRLRSSLFIGVEPGMIEGAAALGAKRIELYTEAYAVGFSKAARAAGAAQAAVAPYAEAAKRAAVLGLGVNAGHDLDLDNLAFFDENLPELLEVSIGHAFVSDALYLGMRETLARYRACLVGQSSTANPAAK
jgi:pyridoxine 5-phosphate synthase